MPDMPERIGRYEVLSLLGQGGMGVLYLARDPVIDRHVALKLLKVDSDDLRRRFVREARSAGRLQHPNIVTVYDVGDHDGELFIAMEYIDGDTLATLIRDDVPFSTLRKLEMLDQLADGLGFAHHRGIVHRDIKPANLMVTRGGLLKVLDFGIARIARHDAVASVAAGTIMGTPAYMAPEQLEGAEIDHRADIFAVGLIIYELLSGRRAFVGASTADVLQKVLTEEPPPIADVVPTIDPDLVRCVARALAKRPEDRYQDLQDLRNDLGRVRRRVELESGSFDATVIVQVPSALRQPAASSTPAPPPVPPTPPPPGGQGVTTSSAGTSEAQTGPQPGPFDAEAEALRHMATRGSQPVRLSVPLDETIVAPLFVPPADASASAVAEAPPVTPPPPVPSPPPVPPGAGAATPASAPRRSVVPALIAVGVIVLVLAVGALGALWWLKGRLLDRFAAATTVAEQTPAAVEPEADRPSASTEAAILPASPGPSAEPTAPTPAEAAPVAATPGAAAAAVSEGQATPSRAPSAAAVTRRDDRATPPAPAPSSGRAPASDGARRTAPAPAPETTVAAPPVAASAPPEPPPAAVVARDEALELVRAYVAARNTGHAAGLRRIWPSVSDLDVRRMTSEFSAPLTLTACDVEAAGPARMRATCRFTQPGTTGFSEGTALTIRRQLVFAMERQGRSWVVADVTG